MQVLSTRSSLSPLTAVAISVDREYIVAVDNKNVAFVWRRDVLPSL